MAVSPESSTPPDTTTPVPNTALLNDFIDLNFAGGLLGTDKTGADKTNVRVRLGDSVTIKTNLPESVLDGLDDEADARDTLGLTAISTQSVTEHCILAGGASNSLTSLPILADGQILVGKTGQDPYETTLQSTDSSITLTQNSTTKTLNFAGKLVQTARATSTAGDNTTTVLPTDNTVPQITEGKEYLTVSITPKSSSNILEISFSAMAGTSVANIVSTALFQDATANALYATGTSTGAGATGIPIAWTHYITAGTTSSITFRVRFGPSVGTVTAYMNQISAGQLYGATEHGTLTVKEYAP